MAAPATLSAQGAPPSSLEFLGFRPGEARAVVEMRLAALDGQWRCTDSWVDPRFSECRGRLRADGGTSLQVTASLIQGRTAVLVIRGPIGAEGLSRWREDLITRYGSVPVKREHGQENWQWVRRSRMIRLTTRIENGVRVVSVSLVDGLLLDDLGAIPPLGPA